MYMYTSKGALHMEKNRFSRFTAILLTIVMLIGCIPAMTSSAADPLSFDADGTFTVLQLADIQQKAPLAAKTRAMITYSIAETDPDLIVLTGDNIIDGITSTTEFRATVDEIVSLLVDSEGNAIPFAVTFGNHDTWYTSIGFSTQYEYYVSKGAIRLTTDSKLTPGTGFVSVNGPSGGKAWNVMLLNSGVLGTDNEHYGKIGYNDASPYVNETRYNQTVSWIESTLSSEAVPTLAFQHIPMQEMYTSGIVVPCSAGDAGAVPVNSGVKDSNAAVTSNYYKPNPDNATITGSLIEPISASGSTTEAEYMALAKSGYVKGIFYGHDHSNTLVGMGTYNGYSLTQGYTMGLTSEWNYSGDIGTRSFTLSTDGTYTTQTYTYTQLSQKYGETASEKVYYYPAGTQFVSSLFVNANSVQSGYTAVQNIADGSAGDLNSGTGGTPVYLGYQTSTDISEALRGVKVHAADQSGAWSNDMLSDGASYTEIAGMTDCNAGAGGAFIYLMESTDVAAGTPITELKVVTSGQMGDYEAYAGYSVAKLIRSYSSSAVTYAAGDAADLNIGAGGDYVYIIYKSTGTDITDAFALLEQAYMRATSLNEARYTPESWSAFKAVLDEAGSVYDTCVSGSNTQYDANAVDAMATRLENAFALLNARDGLVVVPHQDVHIAVPEIIYMEPTTGKSITYQYFVNNTLNFDTGAITPEAVRDNTVGKIYFSCGDASRVNVNAIVVSSDSTEQNSFVMKNTKGEDLCWGGKAYDQHEFSEDLYAGDCYTDSAYGLSPGQTKQIRWNFNVTFTNGDTATYSAYTTMYAIDPTLTIACSMNTRKQWGGFFGVGKSGTNIAVTAWLTGIHSIVSESTNHKEDKKGSFYSNPLLDNSVYATSGGDMLDSPNGDGKGWKGYYKNDTGSETFGGITAGLTIDSSRYAKYNQIPMLTVGIDQNDMNENQYSGASISLGASTTDTNEQHTNISNKFNNGDYAKTKDPDRVYSGVFNDLSITASKVRINGYGKIWKDKNSAEAYAYLYLQPTLVNKGSLRSQIDAVQRQLATYSYADSDRETYESVMRSAYETLGNPMATQSQINSAKSMLDAYLGVATTRYTAQANHIAICRTVDANGAPAATQLRAWKTETNNTLRVGDTLIMTALADPDYTYEGYIKTGNAGSYAAGQTVTLPINYESTEESFTWSPFRYEYLDAGYHLGNFYYSAATGTLRIDPAGGSYTGRTTVTASMGEHYRLLTPTRTGYTFLGWEFSGKGAFADGTYTFAANGSGSVTAKWSKNEIPVFLKDNRPVQIPIGVGTVSHVEYDTASGKGVFTRKDSGKTITYTPGKATTIAETATLTLTDGAVYELTVIPAAVIYYDDASDIASNENGFFTYSTAKPWKTVGSADGSVQTLFKSGDVFGTDDTTGQYFGGVAHTATVTSENTIANNNGAVDYSKTPHVTFTFTGTGFEVLSAVDSDAATVSYTITDSKGKSKNYIVDAFSGYEWNGKAWELSKKETATKYRVPLIRQELQYGTYTVTIGAFYNSYFARSHGSKASYTFTFDGVRVYDPANSVKDTENKNAAIYDAYSKIGQADWTEQTLKSAIKEINSSATLLVDGSEIGGNQYDAVAKASPTNEIWLADGSLTIKLNKGVTKAWLSVACVDGSATIKVENTSYTVNYGTQYIDLGADGSAKMITITKTSGGIVSLRNIRFVGGSVSVAPANTGRISLFMKAHAADEEFHVLAPFTDEELQAHLDALANAEQPTEPVVEPTEPAVDPTEPVVEPTEPATEPTTAEPTTETPSHNDSDGKICGYCGKSHPRTFLGSLVRLIHAVLYFFKTVFGLAKK